MSWGGFAADYHLQSSALPSYVFVEADLLVTKQSRSSISHPAVYMIIFLYHYFIFILIIYPGVITVQPCFLLLFALHYIYFPPPKKIQDSSTCMRINYITLHYIIYVKSLVFFCDYPCNE